MSMVRNLLSSQKLRLKKTRKLYEYEQLEEEVADNDIDAENIMNEAVQSTMAKTQVTSKSEKGSNISVEKSRAQSPRDVTEFDAVSNVGNSESKYNGVSNIKAFDTGALLTGVSNCNVDRAFHAVKVIKADAVQTGVSNYSGESAFQSKKVAKVDAIQTGVSSYSGDGAFQAVKVIKADAIQTGVSKYSGESAFQSKKVVKADAVQTGISKYSGEFAFQSKKVVKADAVQTGISKYSGESAFQSKKVTKADSIQTGTSKYSGESAFTTKKVAKVDYIKTGASSFTGVSMFQTKKIDKRKIDKTFSLNNTTRATRSYVRDSTSTAQNIPEPRGIQSMGLSESSLSSDDLSSSRPTVTYSSRQRAIAIILLSAWPILRLLFLTFPSSSLMSINSPAEAVIIKDISSTLGDASILELEEAISQSAPSLFALQEKQNQAIPAAATKQYSPEHQSPQQQQDQPSHQYNKLRLSGSGTVQQGATLDRTSLRKISRN